MDYIKKWCESEIQGIKHMSDQQLEQLLEEPFSPCPFNPNFDFVKFCAGVEKAYREQLVKGGRNG